MPAPPPVPPAVPALAVCGWKGSGKTTLLETVIPILRRRNLRVRVLKHDAHGIEIDRPGKDSDRLFRAGADVILDGPNESVRRIHRPADPDPLPDLLQAMPSDYDLTLIEGHKTTTMPKVWLQGSGGPRAEPAGNEPLLVLPRDGDRADRFLSFLDEWLPRRWRDRHLFGGILIGGDGRRMGRPKSLLEWRGKPVLVRIVEALEMHTGRVVLLGPGDIPEECRHLTRLPDPPGTAGPIAGLLSAIRWAPAAGWIFASCDLPLLRSEAAGWLEEQRVPGRWAILPRIVPDRVEPLLALYEPQIAGRLEAISDLEGAAPRRLADHPSVLTPAPPGDLADCWRNVNSPEDLDQLP